MIANVPSLSASSSRDLRQTDLFARGFPHHGVALLPASCASATRSQAGRLPSASGSAAAGAGERFDVCMVTGFAPLRDRAMPSCALCPRRIPTRLRRSGQLGDKGSRPRDCWPRRHRRRHARPWLTRSVARFPCRRLFGLPEFPATPATPGVGRLCPARRAADSVRFGEVQQVRRLEPLRLRNPYLRRPAWPSGIDPEVDGAERRDRSRAELTRLPFCSMRPGLRRAKFARERSGFPHWPPLS